MYMKYLAESQDGEELSGGHHGLVVHPALGVPAPNPGSLLHAA